MTIQINDNFANNELSIDELDTIAAGNWLGDLGRGIVHGVEQAAGAVEHLFEGFAGSVAKAWGPTTVYNTVHRPR